MKDSIVICAINMSTVLFFYLECLPFYLYMAWLMCLCVRKVIYCRSGLACVPKKERVEFSKNKTKKTIAKQCC